MIHAAVNKKLNRITINGSLEGLTFAADIYPDDKKAEWTDPTPIKQPARGVRVEEPPCPGCRLTVSKLAKGVKGFLKTVLGADTVDDQTYMDRKVMCLRCPSDCFDFGVCRDDFPNRADSEQGCGCVLALKIPLASESCPHGHWPRA